MKPIRTKPRRTQRRPLRTKATSRVPTRRTGLRKRSERCRPASSISDELQNDVELAKQSVRRSPKRPAGKRKPPALRPSSSAPAKSTKKKNGLGDLLSPKTVQESIKAVGNLRNVVKNCMQYLQQADQMLDTFYVTSNSLKETGVLDKLIKQRGKNMTTEDFTNVLIALMNSPIGGQLFRAMGSQNGQEGSTDVEAAASKNVPPAN